MAALPDHHPKAACRDASANPSTAAVKGSEARNSALGTRDRTSSETTRIRLDPPTSTTDPTSAAVIPVVPHASTAAPPSASRNRSSARSAEAALPKSWPKRLTCLQSWKI